MLAVFGALRSPLKKEEKDEKDGMVNGGWKEVGGG
jgi:hypothetical protein